MVGSADHTKRRGPVNQGVHKDIREPNKIGASVQSLDDERQLVLDRH